MIEQLRKALDDAIYDAAVLRTESVRLTAPDARRIRAALADVNEQLRAALAAINKAITLIENGGAYPTAVPLAAALATLRNLRDRLAAAPSTPEPTWCREHHDYDHCEDAVLAAAAADAEEMRLAVRRALAAPAETPERERIVQEMENEGVVTWGDPRHRGRFLAAAPSTPEPGIDVELLIRDLARKAGYVKAGEAMIRAFARLASKDQTPSAEKEQT